MADENLAFEALDKISGGEGKKFGEGLANLKATEKLAILALIAGAGGAGALGMHKHLTGDWVDKKRYGLEYNRSDGTYVITGKVGRGKRGYTADEINMIFEFLGDIGAKSFSGRELHLAFKPEVFDGKKMTLG